MALAHGELNVVLQQICQILDWEEYGVVMTHIDHVAIIPDGNRRWARAHNVFNPEQIYEVGSGNFRKITESLFSSGVRNVTFWVSSVANLKDRTTSLVMATNRLYARKFIQLAEDPFLMSNGIKLNVYGRWKHFLETNTVSLIDSIIDKTSHNQLSNLTLLIAYDGRTERGEAVLSLLKNFSPELRSGNPIETEQLLRQHSWTGHLPDVDLIIRTGSWNEPHNSADFLSFLVGNSQLVFPAVHWPDFNESWLERSLKDYLNRDRRYGK